MKKYILNITSIVVCLMTVASFSSCDKTEEITEKEKNTKTITSGSWTINSVMVDGTNATSSFTGLTLSFSATNYSTTNGGALWPVDDTWSFANEDATIVTRGDGTEVTVVEITPNKLVLRFNWDKDSGRRTYRSCCRSIHL
jgi:hypothetical protein